MDGSLKILFENTRTMIEGLFKVCAIEVENISIEDEESMEGMIEINCTEQSYGIFREEGKFRFGYYEKIEEVVRNGEVISPPDEQFIESPAKFDTLEKCLTALIKFYYACLSLTYFDYLAEKKISEETCECVTQAAKKACKKDCSYE